MSGYIGYIRVSTLKQGVQGVSLQEQKAAILRYAEKNKFAITIWLEEMKAAAKQGRQSSEKCSKCFAGAKRGV